MLYYYINSISIEKKGDIGMKEKRPFVITISRQLGSGGAYIGQKLAKELNIFYADREIIRKAARELSVLLKDLEPRDEKVLSFWETFIQFNAYSTDIYIPPKIMAPTDRELFQVESGIIERIAKERSAVIIGRCGFHILRDHPDHVSVFLHADAAFRRSRVQKLFNVSEDEAGEMIVQSDKDRELYCRTFTEKKWADAGNYDISIDTGRTGIEKTADIILNYLKTVK